MDVLTIPPTPAAAPVLALPVPAPPALRLAQERSPLATALAVARDLVLLPLRLLKRCAGDVAVTLRHLFGVVWDGGLATLALGFVGALMLVESFGENFFLGEALHALFAWMQAYVPEAGALGMLLVSVFPVLDDVRASTAFAFVVAWAAVLAMSFFFYHLKRYLLSRRPVSTPVQETLLLDPQAQQEAPAPIPGRSSALDLVGLAVGGGAGLCLAGFEGAVLSLVLESTWLGILSAVALLAVRLVFGFVAHLGLHSLIAHAQGAAQHAQGCVATALSVVPNLVDETLQRLQTLGAA